MLDFYFMIDELSFREFLIVNHVQKDLISSRKNDILSHANREKIIVKSTKLEPLKITIQFTVISKQLVHLKRQLSQLFNRNRIFKLTLSDEPHLYYDVIVEGPVPFDDMRKYGKGQVTFLSLYPYALSKLEKRARLDTNKLIFHNMGTYKTYPVFEFTVVSPLKMIGFTHPNGKAIQYGYETGSTVLFTNNVVILDTADCSLYVNGQRKYVNPASRSFAIDPGQVEIGISVNTGATVPSVTGKFKEVFL